jgi:hypothetical protein
MAPAVDETCCRGGLVMKHYRVNKVARTGGHVVKRKDILALSDKDALAVAARDEDCPICDVYQAGHKVGSVT